ncbi:MAG: GNAT family N-acetyltransferase [Clostridia bacterium]|nr:GNAT family N-acetyltransferase [Clostridia bacterium]
MIIKTPIPSQLPEMKGLWMEAFGESSEAVDDFFATAYSHDRCMVLTEEGEVASALYVLDCEYKGDKAAYIYAVATASKYRGRGFCRRLMEAVHEYLKERGYAFALLHPGDESLFDFYRRMGYEICGWVSEISVEASDVPFEVKKMDKDSYARLRKSYLPENAVLPERKAFDYLGSYTSFYSFNGGVMTAFLYGDSRENLFSAEILSACELTDEVLGGIVKALGREKGVFRMIGGDVPFAMGFPLCGEVPARVEFTLALD